jgi:acyl CoA:acetate/3-ketoacid CoA transferase beta subunit
MGNKQLCSTAHDAVADIGDGGSPPEGEEDIDLYNASGQLVSALPGTAYVDSTVSLAPGLTVDDVKAATAAPLRVARDVREMQFE